VRGVEFTFKGREEELDLTIGSELQILGERMEENVKDEINGDAGSRDVQTHKEAANDRKAERISLHWGRQVHLNHHLARKQLVVAY